ncbi:hypothetical protein EQG68_02955 [Flavobacterium piscinae]|uniref:Uncharacterized protein n=1 Tax=Flavobacterium piscinae TaxID=2506424 RepID=A0A4Q1KYC6_9FLAO|nr:hypothetical protein [Flavobacterium piscinae]RXR34885.1 hypothetical protein EQG68_02955 [Flavobacterium piscinae]
MIFFKKPKKEYEILKLFKVVDLETAKKFHTHDSINLILEFLESNYKMLPINIDLNYGKKEWFDLKKFKQGYSKFPSDKTFYLTVYFGSSCSMFSFSNDILNSNNKKESYINITMALNQQFLHSEKTLQFIKELNQMSFFDYGYGLRLNEDFDFESERKYKKSLFGLSISSTITEEDIELEKRKINFKNGYFHKVYPFNIFNKNQINSLNIDQYPNHKLSNFSDKLFYFNLIE